MVLVGIIAMRAPWNTGRVTLLGDALHNMTPYRGMGASMLFSMRIRSGAHY
jgi:hypothetical protein